MQRLYVVAFPEIARIDADALEALRAEHDPEGHALLRAHFTLVFGCTGVSTALAAGAMRSAASRTEPIQFSLARVVLANHGDLHYVFMLPDPGATEMIELHRRLHEGPLAGCLDPNEPFTPHLTLCKTADREHAARVVDQLRGASLQIAGTLATLSLGSRGDGKFETLREIPLGCVDRG
jgi:2'-5' RNA ligase